MDGAMPNTATETAAVRLGVPQDEAGVMALCRLLHAENGTHGINDEKVRATVQRALNRDRSLLLLIGPVGQPVAMMLLLIDPVWFSDEFQLLELFNFVHPDHRRSSHAKQLIGFAKETATELGIDLTIGVLSNERMEAKVRLYARQIPKAGEFFIYRPGTPPAVKD